jgi:hypothetical protein
MSQDAFASPVPGDAVAAPPLSGLMRFFAIAAVVLGLLGLVWLSVQVAVALDVRVVAQFFTGDPHPEAQEQYQALKAARATYQPMGWLVLIASLLASVLMVAGGAVALIRRDLELLAHGALAAAVADVVSVLVQILVRVATNLEWQEYTAVAAGPGGGPAPGTSFAGMVLGWVLVAVFALFWSFAFIRIREVAEG